jgi:MSHA biogenesis protein MshM
MRNWFNRKSISMAGGTVLLAATLAGAGWFLGQNASHQNEVVSHPAGSTQAISALPQPIEAVSSVAAVSEVLATSTAADNSSGTILPLDKTLTLPAEPVVAAQRPQAVPESREPVPAKPVTPVSKAPLLQQRLDATHTVLSAPNHGDLSIQLFYTDDIRPERMERFLGRAQRLGKLAEIYIVPIKLSGRDGYRVLYGLYANGDKARAGMDELPQRYKDAFAPTLYMLDDSQKMP